MTIKSEDITELAKALACFQGIVSGAHKDSTNPFFKSRYADLESVYDAIRVPLSTNGLSVIQLMETIDHTHGLTTIIAHSSGQYWGAWTAMAMGKLDPQGVGSATSYYRRYALCSALGVFQTDDDGNRAQATTVSAKPAPIIDIPKADNPLKHMLITEKQGKRLWAIAHSHGYGEQELKDYLFMEYGYESIRDIKVADYDNICSFIEKHPQSK